MLLFLSLLKAVAVSRLGSMGRLAQGAAIPRFTAARSSRP